MPVCGLLHVGRKQTLRLIYDRRSEPLALGAGDAGGIQIAFWPPCLSSVANGVLSQGGRIMDRTPKPVSLAAALALPRTPGRSTEVFLDGDLEFRFSARPTNGPQIPHLRDEIYIVAAGTARYRVEDQVTEVGPGDLLFVPRMCRTGSRIIQPTSLSGCCSTGQRSNVPCATDGKRRYAKASIPDRAPRVLPFETRCGTEFKGNRFEKALAKVSVWPCPFVWFACSAPRSVATPA